MYGQVALLIDLFDLTLLLPVQMDFINLQGKLLWKPLR